MAHGFWTGDRGGKVNPGYRHFENYQVRAEINKCVELDEDRVFKHFKRGYNQQRIHDIFAQRMPNRDWVYKVGVDHWPIINGLYDPMTCIIVRRNLESVIESQISKRVGLARDRELCRRVNTARVEFLDHLADEYGFPVVQSEELIAGDYSSVAAALDYVGVEFNPDIARERIHTGLWNH